MERVFRWLKTASTNVNLLRPVSESAYRFENLSMFKVRD